MLASPALALTTVTSVTDYGSYSNGFLSTVTGRQIDQSTAGITFILGNPFIGSGSNGLNSSYVVLNSPDGTTKEWWVYARMIDSSIANTTNPDGFVIPPNIRITVECDSQGGTYNITSTLQNATWRTDYTLFNIKSEGSHQTYYALPSSSGVSLSSPTGVDLLSNYNDCYFAVYPEDWNNPNMYVEFSVWNVNPSRQELCNVDPTVASLQSTTMGIVNINYSIWSIMFDLFQVVIVLVAIFGIPILLIKMVRWVFSEVKKINGGKKVF